MKPEPAPPKVYLQPNEAIYYSAEGSHDWGDRIVYVPEAALEKANAEVEQYKTCAFQAQEMAKEIAASLSEQRERLEKMEWALTRIADVTSALHCGGRKTSFADFELRQIAREALKEFP